MFRSQRLRAPDLCRALLPRRTGCVRASCALGLATLVAGCSPALDWRELRPEGTAVELLMPCRPAQQARQVTLAGEPRRLSLLVCTAGGQTWGFASTDVGDPAQVGLVLEALLAAAAANIQADPPAAGAPSRPIAVPGATPNGASRRTLLVGQMPDGAAVQSQVAVFAYGTAVHQATVIGPAAGQVEAETFFAGLRVGR
jgi:hypothetical protein